MALLIMLKSVMEKQTVNTSLQWYQIPDLVNCEPNL